MDQGMWEIVLNAISDVRTEMRLSAQENRKQLEAFRSDFTEWQQVYIEKLAKAEVEIKTGITGNGQPSRLKIVEDSLKSVQKFRYKISGAVAAGLTAGTIFGSVITLAVNAYLHANPK